MSRSVVVVVLPALLALAIGSAHAQTAGRANGPLVYPARGQSAQQTDRDRYECHDWARRETGFDPAQRTPAPPPAQARKRSAYERGVAACLEARGYVVK